MASLVGMATIVAMAAVFGLKGIQGNCNGIIHVLETLRISTDTILTGVQDEFRLL